MSKAPKLTASEISISLTEIRLLNFWFDDRKRNNEGLFQLFGYHIILSPTEKKAYVGAQISVSNPELENVLAACEMTVHFEFSFKRKGTNEALTEFLDDGAYPDLKRELAVFFINIAHSTIRGMWFMATRGTQYHEEFDVPLAIPNLDRVKLDVSPSPVASPEQEAS